MFDNRSLKWPITLGVVMIVLVILLLVGWVLINVIGAVDNKESAGTYWTLLTLGSLSLACILAGVIMYLVLTVRAINLNRRQSNFVDSVTHELKSPIASLKLYLQTLARHEVSASQRRDFHRYMLDDVERLDQLINHLLDAARVGQAKGTGRAEECRIDHLLVDCAAVVCQRHHLPVGAIEVDAVPTIIEANPMDLTILFRNLIDNAIKYGGTPAEVMVESRYDSGQASILVVDNGSGIPRHLRRKIFGRFVRLGNELERSRQGTGLGLYLVRTIVRSLGGTIRVRDRRGCSGTEFELVLPQARPGPQSPADAADPRSFPTEKSLREKI